MQHLPKDRNLIERVGNAGPGEHLLKPRISIPRSELKRAFAPNGRGHTTENAGVFPSRRPRKWRRGQVGHDELQSALADY